MFSCNDALMQIVAKEGRDTFYHYENDFGIGKKTGIDLPGEEAGLIFEKDKLNATELATSSFGQSFTTTMLQMASAFSSLVNGGSYYQPHIVKEIVNDSGATVKENDGVVVRQTVSEQTSDFIQQALYRTVEEGTAQGAQVEGYAVGGKTATAQKLPRAAKTYTVSFLGCVPAINPEVVIYVWIDEPQKVEVQADSSIATKFASKIMKEILPALDIYPEGDIDYLLGDENSDDANNTAQNTSETNNSEATTNAENVNSNTESNTGTEASGGANSENTESTGTEQENESGTGQGNNAEEDIYNPDFIE
jgi:stage V sporulation protein D (sporulation-specific penicillin-binding protein)